MCAISQYILLFGCLFGITFSSPPQENDTKESIKDFRRGLYINCPYSIYDGRGFKIGITKSDNAAVKAVLEDDDSYFSKPNLSLSKQTLPVFLASVYSGKFEMAKTIYKSPIFNSEDKIKYLMCAKKIARHYSHPQIVSWLDFIMDPYVQATDFNFLLDKSSRVCVEDYWLLQSLLLFYSEQSYTSKLNAASVIQFLEDCVPPTMYPQAFMSEIVWNFLNPSVFPDAITYEEFVAGFLIAHGYVDSKIAKNFVNLEYCLKHDKYNGAVRWLSAARMFRIYKLPFQEECFQSLITSLTDPALIEKKFYKEVLQFKPSKTNSTPLQLATYVLQDEKVVKNLRSYGFRWEGEKGTLQKMFGHFFH